jgi:cholesterol oxidase
MAEENRKQDGVVSPVGEVFDNENLFVIDGAIVPSALGVNPSLTIAALAERIAEHLVETLPARIGARGMGVGRPDRGTFGTPRQ